MAATTPANAPVSSSKRRDRKIPGRPSEREIRGSLMNRPGTVRSRCAMKYERSDTSRSGGEDPRERCLWIPWASVIVMRRICLTPADRFARTSSKRSGGIFLLSF
jgi:hypothetical protein